MLSLNAYHTNCCVLAHWNSNVNVVPLFWFFFLFLLMLLYLFVHPFLLCNIPITTTYLIQYFTYEQHPMPPMASSTKENRRHQILGSCHHREKISIREQVARIRGSPDLVCRYHHRTSSSYAKYPRPSGCWHAYILYIYIDWQKSREKWLVMVCSIQRFAHNHNAESKALKTNLDIRHTDLMGCRFRIEDNTHLAYIWSMGMCVWYAVSASHLVCLPLHFLECCHACDELSICSKLNLNENILVRFFLPLSI